MSFTTLVLIAIVIVFAGCNQAPTRPTVPEQPPVTTAPSNPSPPIVATLSISSLSPATVIAGSGDITITITGSGFQSPTVCCFVSSFAVWSADTMLLTKYVSETQLTAVIPASRLKDPATAQVLVVNGDSMGWTDGYRGYPQSNAVPFAIVASH